MPKISSTLDKRVLEYQKVHKLWDKQDKIILSVSGGVDSMVMMDVVYRSIRSHKAHVHVVTFDHQVRVESAEEVVFVQNTAQRYGFSCDIHRLALEKGSNFQEIARNKRREILLEYIASGHSQWIATAHHANDQAETVFFRMGRGTGISGLQAMLPKKEVWVRPLLGCYREEIVAYAQEHNLEWREDASNPSSTRGEIRAIFRQITEVFPQFIQGLQSTAGILAREHDYMDMMVEQAWIRVAVGSPSGWRLRYALLRLEHDAIQIRLVEKLLAIHEIHGKLALYESFLRWHPQGNGMLQIYATWSLCYEQGMLGLRSV